MNANRRSGYTLFDIVMQLYIVALLVLFSFGIMWVEDTIGLRAIVDHAAAAVGASRGLARDLLAVVTAFLLFVTAGLVFFGTFWSLGKLEEKSLIRQPNRQGHLFCKRATKFHIVFERVPQRQRHGVAIDSPAPSPVVRWADSVPGIIEFDVPDGSVMISVTPVRDAGEGVIEARRRRAYLKWSDIPDGCRYRCNDGIAYKNDADFDHFVFRVERVI